MDKTSLLVLFLFVWQLKWTKAQQLGILSPKSIAVNNPGELGLRPTQQTPTALQQTQNLHGTPLLYTPYSTYMNPYQYPVQYVHPHSISRGNSVPQANPYFVQRQKQLNSVVPSYAYLIANNPYQMTGHNAHQVSLENLYKTNPASFNNIYHQGYIPPQVAARYKAFSGPTHRQVAYQGNSFLTNSPYNQQRLNNFMPANLHEKSIENHLSQPEEIQYTTTTPPKPTTKRPPTFRTFNGKDFADHSRQQIDNRRKSLSSNRYPPRKIIDSDIGYGTYIPQKGRKIYEDRNKLKRFNSAYIHSEHNSPVTENPLLYVQQTTPKYIDSFQLRRSPNKILQKNKISKETLTSFETNQPANVRDDIDREIIHSDRVNFPTYLKNFDIASNEGISNQEHFISTKDHNYLPYSPLKSNYRILHEAEYSGRYRNEGTPNHTKERLNLVDVAHQEGYHKVDELVPHNLPNRPPHSYRGIDQTNTLHESDVNKYHKKYAVPVTDHPNFIGEHESEHVTYSPAVPATVQTPQSRTTFAPNNYHYTPIYPSKQATTYPPQSSLEYTTINPVKHHSAWPITPPPSFFPDRSKYEDGDKYQEKSSKFINDFSHKKYRKEPITGQFPTVIETNYNNYPSLEYGTYTRHVNSPELIQTGPFIPETYPRKKLSSLPNSFLTNSKLHSDDINDQQRQRYPSQHPTSYETEVRNYIASELVDPNQYSLKRGTLEKDQLPILPEQSVYNKISKSSQEKSNLIEDNVYFSPLVTLAPPTTPHSVLSDNFNKVKELNPRLYPSKELQKITLIESYPHQFSGPTSKPLFPESTTNKYSPGNLRLRPKPMVPYQETFDQFDGLFPVHPLQERRSRFLRRRRRPLWVRLARQLEDESYPILPYINVPSIPVINKEESFHYLKETPNIIQYSDKLNEKSNSVPETQFLHNRIEEAKVRKPQIEIKTQKTTLSPNNSVNKLKQSLNVLRNTKLQPPQKEDFKMAESTSYEIRKQYRKRRRTTTTTKPSFVDISLEMSEGLSLENVYSPYLKYLQEWDKKNG